MYLKRATLSASRSLNGLRDNYDEESGNMKALPSKLGLADPNTRKMAIGGLAAFALLVLYLFFSPSSADSLEGGTVRSSACVRHFRGIERPQWQLVWSICAPVAHACAAHASQARIDGSLRRRSGVTFLAAARPPASAELPDGGCRGLLSQP